MRELDRIPTPLAIVGAGRLGTALAAALRASGLEIDGPLGRGADLRAAGAVLLCVPDGEIAAAAAAIRPRVPVGHCSGATGLDALSGHEAFAFHPLMTVPRGTGGVREGAQRGVEDGAAARDSMPVPHDGEAVNRVTGAGVAGDALPVPHDGEAVTTVFTGAGAAVAGSSPRALAIAEELAARLGMRATTVADEDRVAYHAAASIASNLLTTLEGAAERLAATAGVDRELLAPLVRASVENWVRLGAERAMTGPIARGDEGTVERHRAAIAERAPDLLPMYDALVDATRTLIGAPQ
jgi:predicted short-subunit dehydrogenase-like oxidoreductase (DUF2520 family)